MVLLVGMVFAILAEAHQFLIPQRGFQVVDLLVDFMGLISVCGYINMKMERRRWEASTKRKQCNVEKCTG